MQYQWVLRSLSASTYKLYSISYIVLSLRNKQLALSSSEIMGRVKVTYEAFRGHTFCELTGFTLFDRTVGFGFFLDMQILGKSIFLVSHIDVSVECAINVCRLVCWKKKLFVSGFANFSNSLCFSTYSFIIHYSTHSAQMTTYVILFCTHFRRWWKITQTVILNNAYNIICHFSLPPVTQVVFSFVR